MNKRMKTTSAVLVVVVLIAAIFVLFLFRQSKTNLGKLTGEMCSYGGTEYRYGDSFPASDGCNNCSCGEAGLVSCTLMACDSTY